MTANSSADALAANFIPEEIPRDFSRNNRLLIIAPMSIVTGIFGAVSAWGLQKLISLVTNIAYFGRFSTQNFSIPSHLAWTSVLIPVAGCFIIGLMARFGSEKIRGHGIPEAIEAILIGKSRIQPKVALLKPLSSAISIGTGGPFGAEGPIIMTGGALGSIFAQMFHLSSAERKTLLVAGAAAGMSATFNTPVAAMLLAVELLLFEWKPRSFIPVSIAAMVAATLRPFLLGSGALFPIPDIPALPSYALLICAAVGILSGLLSGLLTQMVYKAEDIFESLPLHWMWWPMIGGAAIGIGGLVEPHALGVGYDNIATLLQGNLSGHEAARLLVVKALIWAIALGSGTSGGVLAPLLMMGGAMGALVAPYLPCGDSSFWALIAMAAVMSGTMRAPLTSAVFALELTHNINALLPLAAACVVAQGTTVLLLKRSILTEKIARHGHHVFREYSVDPFEMVRVEEIMNRAIGTVPDTATVKDIASLFSKAAAGEQNQYYAVTTPKGKPLGVFSHADVLNWSAQGHKPESSVQKHLDTAEAIIGYTHEFSGRLADRMARAQAKYALILHKQKKALVGIVTHADLLHVRSKGIQQEEDHEILLRVRKRGKKE